MTNPFIAAAAQQREDAGCEERIAVCEAHVCSEPAGSDEPFSPTTVKRTPSWWTPFGSVNRTKSGGILSRKNTLNARLHDDVGAFDVEEAGKDQGACCTLQGFLDQPRIVHFGLFAMAGTLLFSTVAVALYIFRHN